MTAGPEPIPPSVRPADDGAAGPAPRPGASWRPSACGRPKGATGRGTPVRPGPARRRGAGGPRQAPASRAPPFRQGPPRGALALPLRPPVAIEDLVGVAAGGGGGVLRGPPPAPLGPGRRRPPRPQRAEHRDRRTCPPARRPGRTEERASPPAHLPAGGPAVRPGPPGPVVRPSDGCPERCRSGAGAVPWLTPRPRRRAARASRPAHGGTRRCPPWSDHRSRDAAARARGPAPRRSRPGPDR